MPLFGMLPSLPTARHLTRSLRPLATKNLVIYSKATGERRMVVDADNDAEYDQIIQNLHPGEGYYFIDHNTYDKIGNGNDLNIHCAKQAGFQDQPDPDNSRHIVVDDKNQVIHALKADPTCGDTGEHFGKGYLLIQDNVTEKDTAYNPTVAQAKQAIFVTDKQNSIAIPKG